MSRNSAIDGTKSTSEGTMMQEATLSATAVAAAAAGDGNSRELRDALRQATTGSTWNANGAAVIGGLPVDAAATVVESCSRALGPLLPQDAAGELVREVRYRGMALGEGATGRYSDSREGGSAHTDGPHRATDPPSMFALLCVRQAARGGALALIDVDQVVQRLDPGTVTCLQTEFTFDQREPEAPPVSRAVLQRSGAGPWQLVYLREYIDLGHQHPSVQPLDDGRRRALDALDAAIESLRTDPEGHTEIKLRPGQMIVVDNRRRLHARTSFGDEVEDRDRLMLRTWIGAETDRSES